MLGGQSGSEDIRGSAQGSGLILRAGEGSPGRVLSRCCCDQVSVLDQVGGAGCALLWEFHCEAPGIVDFLILGGASGVSRKGERPWAPESHRPGLESQLSC